MYVLNAPYYTYSLSMSVEFFFFEMPVPRADITLQALCSDTHSGYITHSVRKCLAR